ncbi:hypothetical protein Poli38472_007422 [Pythium oligandrum]|uniref:Uncharacterized protein n=1 Tax=Pythium oligandrum TaxID=41045 RepID=A0A8K1CQM8_PYTOL|nr:hypothetical protein Poli38472_007422 [Pythium oligandrum]|eukprot:TMW67750.1 hypothetical protein Poli38472_007422 [Pythium oligandrum]
MFGMSVFVPLAVLAYGSYQVFFPEVNLDVQTSPVLNVSAQIVKAAMMGALTFFVKQVRLFLGVALAGNLHLLFLVLRFELCSTWHLKYSKVLIYAVSSWSALCALLSTFLSEADRDSIPLYTMHAGWALQTLAYFYAVRRRHQQKKAQLKSGLFVTRHVQSRQQPAELVVAKH